MIAFVRRLVLVYITLHEHGYNTRNASRFVSVIYYCMPSGATHDKIAVAVSPLAAGITSATLAWGLHAPPLSALFGGLILTASHLACSNWLSPDLDLGSSEIDERWGRLRFIWRPYDRAVPHRHWMSHSGFSVLGRLLYLYLALNLILLGVGVVMLLQALLIGLFVSGTPTGQAVASWLVNQYLVLSSGGVRLVLSYPQVALLVIIGAVLSDALHSISDVISTALKRRRHKRHHRATWPATHLLHMGRRLHTASLANVRWLGIHGKRAVPRRRYRSSLRPPGQVRRRP